FFIGLLEALLERIVTLGEISGVARAHFRELILNAFGDAQAVFGIEPVVRIAERVNVAFGTGHLAGGNLENLGEAGSVKVAPCAPITNKNWNRNSLALVKRSLGTSHKWP